MSKKDTKIKDILKFIFELGQLRRIKHEGWRLIGIQNPESVAEHTLRAAQIGFILAKMENYHNPYEVSTMIIFHDIGETRIGDLHKLAHKYITVDEERATEEQLEKIGEMGANILELWKQVENQNTQAGIIAKDADLLEQAFMAKEYLEKGYIAAKHWIENVAKALKTDSAKKLLTNLDQVNSYDWLLAIKISDS
ncbi:MAG: HD domain-containing protein [Moorea sp. SIO2B7]|nr:HD domain-containing protein [Moorena sp. SIO2B7]